MPTLDFKGKSVIETYHHAVAHYMLESGPKLPLPAKGQTPSLEGGLPALKAILHTHAGKNKQSAVQHRQRGLDFQKRLPCNPRVRRQNAREGVLNRKYKERLEGNAASDCPKAVWALIMTLTCRD
jgi:hypothetical protein